MGNLSCVSCKVKDKNGQPYKSAVNQLGLGDFKGANFSHDVIDVVESKSSLDQVHLQVKDGSINDISSSHLPTHDKTDSQSRLSALDMYKVIKENKRMKLDELGEEEDDEDFADTDEEKDDVEKAAKAIVDMSLFITTKVIYPAYVRYLEEDHPELYIQYFGRPSTPLPIDNPG